MTENSFDVECPYCHTRHELAESIDCNCGAHGHRRLQGMLLGWFWSKGGYKKDECEGCGRELFPSDTVCSMCGTRRL